MLEKMKEMLAEQLNCEASTIKDFPKKWLQGKNILILKLFYS